MQIRAIITVLPIFIKLFIWVVKTVEQPSKKESASSQVGYAQQVGGMNGRWS